MITRRHFTRNLLSTPFLLSSLYAVARAEDEKRTGLDNEVDDLLKRERLLDAAVCDRYWRHPAEKPLVYHPESYLPLVGGGITGIGHLTEEIPIKELDRMNMNLPPQISSVDALTPSGELQQILREFETLRQLEARHADKMVVVGTADEMERAVRAGKLAIVPGIDSGNETGGDPLVLAELYRLGLRKMALTHEAATPFCGSNSSELKTTPGLTPLAKVMVAECNRLGIMIDVSHCSDITFWGLVETTERPIIATHSGARVLPGEKRRNLSDDMLRAIATSGGMVGVGGATEDVLFRKMKAAGFYTDLTRIGVWMRQKYPDPWELSDALRNPAAQAEARRALGLPQKLPGSQWETALLNPESTVIHLDYIAGKIGFDHVGLGTDVEMYKPEYPWMIRGFVAGLLKRNYSQENIRKIFNANLLRVFRDNGPAAA